ncbi:MAG: 6-carboxytetrahydropterin synthase [Chloroflexi bacterium]|nr:6-carboxytetrahydropterin synthase [Chloroflexota bacterium]
MFFGGKMGAVTIYKRTDFEAAHKLEGHPKCGVLHGHSYKVEVWLTGTPTGPWGFVSDFGGIKEYFRQFDHSDAVITKSAEILALEAAAHFKTDNVTKVVVRIWESATSYAEAVFDEDELSTKTRR